MHPAHGPVYEVSLSIDRQLADEFDAWLAEHIRQMLEIPGFVRARTFETGGDSPDRVCRIVLYEMESEQALQEYLAGPAEEMRAGGAARFGDKLRASRRILQPGDAPEPDAGVLEACLNCGTPLQGQYCARCGQRARGRLISIWELIRDAVGDLFELDSRLWRTIIPLMFRPGQLTHEYLIGRRARFMPPFRTYLVLSLVFFLVAFFDPQEQLGILYEPQEATPAAAEDPAQAAREIRREVLEDLAADGVITLDPEEGKARVPAAPDGPGEQQDTSETSGLNIRINPEGDLATSCDLGDFTPSGPDWFTRRVTRERLQEVCERVAADSGRSFLNQLLDNIPAALFVLLPLMAFVLKLLYPLSKRYYVEHLLFVLHFHAFFFLILTLEILFSRLVSWGNLPSVVSNFSVFAVSLYVPVYLYKSMRRVYQQGRTITLLKYFVLILTYAAGLTVMLLIAAFYTAFSI